MSLGTHPTGGGEQNPAYFTNQHKINIQKIKGHLKNRDVRLISGWDIPVAVALIGSALIGWAALKHFSIPHTNISVPSGWHNYFFIGAGTVAGIRWLKMVYDYRKHLHRQQKQNNAVTAVVNHFEKLSDNNPRLEKYAFFPCEDHYATKSHDLPEGWKQSSKQLVPPTTKKVIDLMNNTQDIRTPNSKQNEEQKGYLKMYYTKGRAFLQQKKSDQTFYTKQVSFSLIDEKQNDTQGEIYILTTSKHLETGVPKALMHHITTIQTIPHSKEASIFDTLINCLSSDKKASPQEKIHLGLQKLFNDLPENVNHKTELLIVVDYKGELIVGNRGQMRAATSLEGNLSFISNRSNAPSITRSKIRHGETLILASQHVWNSISKKKFQAIWTKKHISAPVRALTTMCCVREQVGEKPLAITAVEYEKQEEKNKA